eukprot:4919490-Karenia_brevis.AAC.1
MMQSKHHLIYTLCYDLSRRIPDYQILWRQDLRDLHMSIATTPYRLLMNKPVPIQHWLLAVYKLMEKRQRLVEDLTLP